MCRDPGPGTGVVFEADLVSHLLSKFHTHLLGHPSGEQARGEAAGLERHDTAVAGQPVSKKYLRDLRRLTRSSRSLEHEPARAGQSGNDLRFEIVDGKASGHALFELFPELFELLPKTLKLGLQLFGKVLESG